MESDESDFYGDEQTVRKLEDRIDRFDPEEYLERQRTASATPWIFRKSSPAEGPVRYHNAYEGVVSAKQLGESLDDFLERMPPDTTEASSAIPWIYISNPYIAGRLASAAASQAYKADRDEAPADEDAQVDLFTRKAMDLLHAFSDFKREKEQSTGKPQSSIAAAIAKERRSVVESILDLAHDLKVRTGKWMLFCPPSEVGDVWRIVAKAVWNNELGIAAKVAPRPDPDGPGGPSERVICVYTSDFRNTKEVEGVLQRLRELRLVEARSRYIYYKPDAYTYLGIASSNVWGIRASLYSSKDLFERKTSV